MKFTLATAIASVFLAASGSAFAATLSNGSMTGPTGNTVVPSGWSMLSPSPDTNDIDDAAGTGSNYAVTPTASSDGGTWVGIARTGSTIESFGQTVSDFLIGEDYTLSWENANFGYNCCGYVSSNAVEVLLDGVSIGTGALRAMTAETWWAETLSFTATDTSHEISFRLGNADQAYMQIDGVALALSAAPVPVPASLPLLAAGLGGIVLLARRKTKGA